MLKPKFIGRSQNGLRLENRAAFERLLKELEGQDIEVTLSKRTKDRSNRQNKYYWGVVVKLIGDHMGMGKTKPEQLAVHDYLRDMFASYKVGPITVRKESSAFTTVEMEEYLQTVREWASEFLGVMIPLPNEVDFSQEI